MIRRKKFLVDKSLQLSFVLMNLSYAMLLLIAMAVSLFVPLIFQINNLDAQSTEASDAAVNILYLHDRFWLPVLLTLILVTAHSLKTTHRIAGPLFRFRSVFASIEAGILPKPVKLRKNDFLDAELNAINRMLESLRSQVSEITRLAERLHESAARYGESVDHSRTIQATDELWNDIVQTEDQLLKVLSRFRIET
jgi:methyl-accepting chemotaxis protein